MEQLDSDLTCYFEEYYKNKFPFASSIIVSNLIEDEEDKTLYFDANWLFEDFKVKDIKQADFGRKEISIAESEMPGLMAIRNEF